jgi:hypothetical protein
MKAAGAPVGAVEKVAGAVSVSAVADDVVEEAAGARVVAGGDGRLGFVQPGGENPLGLHGGGACLLEALASFDVLGIQQEDAAEDVGRVCAAVAPQEVTSLVEKAPQAVSLDTRQIA